MSPIFGFKSPTNPPAQTGGMSFISGQTITLTGIGGMSWYNTPPASLSPEEEEKLAEENRALERELAELEIEVKRLRSILED